MAWALSLPQWMQPQLQNHSWRSRESTMMRYVNEIWDPKKLEPSGSLPPPPHPGLDRAVTVVAAHRAREVHALSATASCRGTTTAMCRPCCGRRRGGEGEGWRPGVCPSKVGAASMPLMCGTAAAPEMWSILVSSEGVDGIQVEELRGAAWSHGQVLTEKRGTRFPNKTADLIWHEEG
jgi:hypothetical protein